MNKKMSIPAGWRLLGVGDRIQKGDRYWSNNTGPWVEYCTAGSDESCDNCIGELLDGSEFPHIRREEVPIPEGWRRLEPDEVVERNDRMGRNNYYIDVHSTIGKLVRDAEVPSLCGSIFVFIRRVSGGVKVSELQARIERLEIENTSLRNRYEEVGAILSPGTVVENVSDVARLRMSQLSDLRRQHNALREYVRVAYMGGNAT